MIVQVEVGRSINGRHLDGSNRWHTRLDGQPKQAVEIAVLRDRARLRSVRGDDEPACVDALLGYDPEELRQVRPEGAVSQRRPQAEPQAFEGFISGDSLVAGPETGGDEGRQLAVPRAGCVPVCYEPPEVGFDDRHSEWGLFALEKAGPGGRLADTRCQGVVQDL